MERNIKICLKELVESRNMSLRELARLSDIEPSIINKLANNKHERICLAHLERISEALKIDNINEIIRIEKRDSELGESII